MAIEIGTGPMKRRERIFWFLATPALLWLGLVCQLCGTGVDAQVLIPNDDHPDDPIL